MANPNVKFFFLVAGYDYEGKGAKNGLDFDSMCLHRVNEWIWFINKSVDQKDAVVSADTTLRFLRFSVETGKIEVIEQEFVAGRGIKQGSAKQSDWKPLNTIGTGDKFDPITFVSKGPFRAIDEAADYEGLRLKQSAATRDIISIVDVYNSVRGAPEGSVLEFSVFSHGWIGGPVLVNSADKLNTPQLRDPDDKDGRALLDFNVLMGEQSDGTINAPLRLFRFMRAFDPRGVMQAWGCEYDIENPLIQQTLQQIRKGKVTDDTILDFDFSDPRWPKRYPLMHSTSTFFPDDQSVVKIRRTFSRVKRFLRRRLEVSYAFQFASHVPGLYVLGALPGTGAEDEKRSWKLMQVCKKKTLQPKPLPRNWKPECSDGYAPTHNFYLKHFGIKNDIRGYGIFDAKTVQKIAADIDADIAADAADSR